MNAKKFRLKDGWILTRDGYLVGLTSAEVYKLNKTAKRIVENIRQGKSIEEIYEDIVGTYGVTHKKAQEDVDIFLKILKDQGIIQED